MLNFMNMNPILIHMKSYLDFMHISHCKEIKSMIIHCSWNELTKEFMLVTWILHERGIICVATSSKIWEYPWNVFACLTCLMTFSKRKKMQIYTKQLYQTFSIPYLGSGSHLNASLASAKCKISIPIGHQKKKIFTILPINT